MFVKTLSVLSLVFLVAGCAPIAVSVDYDPEATLTGFRTFGLLPDPEATGHPRADNPLLHQRVRAALGDQMKAQGYTLSEDPDIWVGYHLAIEKKLDVRVVNGAYGYGHWRYGSPGPVGPAYTDVREYKQGMLIVDIVDARRKLVVWRGVGETRLSQQPPPPEQQEERVRVAVAEILKRFPPNGG